MVFIIFLYFSAFCSLTVVHFNINTFFCAHNSLLYVLILIFKMPTTFEILAGRTNFNVQEIEFWRTRTQYCSNHWLIVFKEQNGENFSANLIRRLDGMYIVEWTRDIDLQPAGFIKFDVSYHSLTIQGLATCIFDARLSDPQMPGFCCCLQWV